jgi:predicted nucleic-acid-binding protein
MGEAATMKAVDTNIVLRFMLGDDEGQSRTAEEIFLGPCYIALTVLIETGWVLAYSYGRSRTQIADGLLALIDQPKVSLENENVVRWALARYRDDNADLADMIHLVASMRYEQFSTFDRKLAVQAGPDAPVSIETLT